jgi:hypothetical protein
VAAQDASCRERTPFASVVSPHAGASFVPTHKGSSSSDPIFLDSLFGYDENYISQRGRSGHLGQSAEDLVQGAKRRSIEPSASMIFSCESDEDDDFLPASTPEKKKGIARLSYMTSNGGLVTDIAQGVIDLAARKGTAEPDSQDLCKIIDQILDSK